MVAALFALHPINVESVVWIAERKNLLSMLFFLLALGAYRWYAREPRPRRYVVVAILFALGLMAKPQIITLPFVLLLWDYWPLRRMAIDGQAAVDTPGERSALAKGRLERGALPQRSFSRSAVEKLPLVALSAISAVITMKAQKRVAASIQRYRFRQGWRTRLSATRATWVRRFGRRVSRRCIPIPATTCRRGRCSRLCFFLLVLTALVAAGRRHRYLPVGWLWFLGTLIPMIGLVQVGRQAMADRYAYLPFIGLFIMICWGVPDAIAATSRWLERRRGELTAASAEAANKRPAHQRCFAGDGLRRRFGGAGRGDSSPDRLLERQRDAMVAHLAGHEPQLRS